MNIFTFASQIMTAIAEATTVSLGAVTKGAQALDNTMAMAEQATANMLKEQQIEADKLIRELEEESKAS